MFRADQILHVIMWRVFQIKFNKQGTPANVQYKLYIFRYTLELNIWFTFRSEYNHEKENNNYRCDKFKISALEANKRLTPPSALNFKL